MKNWFYILSICLFLMACRKEEIIVGELRKTDAFRKIEIDGSFDVVLSQDSIFSVQFESDRVFFDALSFELNDSVLIVHDGKSARWRNPQAKKPVVRIAGHHLQEIFLRETCYLTTKNPIESDEFGLVAVSKLNMADIEVNCKVFYYWNNHPCGGEIKVRGTTDELKIWNFAIMKVDASACRTRYAWVENYSKADVRVNVQEQIDYAIGGTGNILVKGNPTKVVELKPATDSGEFILSP